jgi:hypothetical protein
MFKNLFKITPLSFRERRELVLRKWERYGYKQKPPQPKAAIYLADKVHSLMMAY